MTVQTESVHELRSFLSGTSSSQELEAWLAGLDYDELSDKEREDFGVLRLLLIEYGEGLRPLDEARDEARRLLAEARSV